MSRSVKFHQDSYFTPVPAEGERLLLFLHLTDRAGTLFVSQEAAYYARRSS
jgi:hypothetical protein